MTDSIVDGTNIDFTKIVYSQPKPHETGGKVVNIYNSDTKQSFSLSTPLIFTWGAQEVLDTQRNPTGKYSMSLQFPDSEHNNPELTAFRANMERFVDKVLDDAVTNSEQWFGEKIELKAIVKSKMYDMLKFPKFKNSQKKDLSKPPTLTVKIPCWKGVWQSEIYDEEGEPLFVSGQVNPEQSPITYLLPKIHTINCITCGGIWFTGNSFSITWNLVQAVVQKPKTTTLKGKCFIKPKSSDVERLKALPPPEVPEESHIVETQVLDSDDDDDNTKSEVVAASYAAVPPPAPTPISVPAPAVVDEPVVEVAKKVVKKVVRKTTDK